MKIIIPALLVAVVVIGFFAGADSVDVVSAEQQSYCEMVGIWKDTNGEYGHPDYRQTFTELCVDK